MHYTMTASKLFTVSRCLFNVRRLDGFEKLIPLALGNKRGRVSSHSIDSPSPLPNQSTTHYVAHNGFAAPLPVLSHTTTATTYKSRLVHGRGGRRAVMAAAAATPLSSRQIMGGVEANMAGVNSSYLGPLRSLLYSAKLSHVTQTRLSSGGIGSGAVVKHTARLLLLVVTQYTKHPALNSTNSYNNDRHLPTAPPQTLRPAIHWCISLLELKFAKLAYLFACPPCLSII